MLPIFDLHCDLLSYLANHPKTTAENPEIGCALPHLKSGKVKVQTMAIYTPSSAGSTEYGQRQIEIYRQLLDNGIFNAAHSLEQIKVILNDPARVGMVPAIENGSGFCEEDEPLQKGLERLDKMVEQLGKVLYISFTHHHENRFGGGNYTDIGLKKDGKALLEHLAENHPEIAVDLSHTSDELAYDILRYVSMKRLNIPIIASHSNFRTIWDNPRNLPDEYVQEIVERQGLIGMNFLRAYVHEEQPSKLLHHILYGINQKAHKHLAYGADFFFTGDHPDTSRVPFFFPEHENASKYPEINRDLKDYISRQDIDALSYGNVLSFLERVWKY
ncbi:MAG TPA: peptidase [Microscillaceae bacterium]|nr:peptidase [Microscillaceae bacterium]